MSGHIYVIINRVNCKMYVGQSVCYLSSGRKYGAHQRWNSHKQRALRGDTGCSFLYSSMRKYGVENFEMNILLECEISQLDIYECFYIQTLNTLYPHGYNIENGGCANKILGETTKEKISKARKSKHIHSNEVDSLLIEFGFPLLPYGINYTSDSNKGYKGFCVVKHPQRMFVTRHLPLKLMFERALEYLDIVTNDMSKLEMFVSKIEQQNKLYKASLLKYTSREVQECLDILHLECIPLYVHYDKRKQRFYVCSPDISKYFGTYDPLGTLKQCIDFLNLNRNGCPSESPAKTQ